jgi:hypothetical protein
MTRRARRWRSVIGDAVNVVSAERWVHDHAAFGLDVDELRAERVRLVVPGEPMFIGAEAVARAHAHPRGEQWRWMVWRAMPPVRWAARGRFAVERRFDRQFAAIGRWMQGAPERPRHEVTRWLYLRVLGLVVIAAFASLWVQLDGLIGAQGIDPAADVMQRVSRHADDAGWRRFVEMPTLLWWRADDGFLRLLCAAGLAAGGLLMLNLLPAIAVLVAAVAYGSLTATSVFFGYQWDALLIETLVMTLFIVPWHPLPGRYRGPPSTMGMVTMRLLLFRLMFASGVVKLTSGDPMWAEWTAMTVHYETQPLPHGWSRFFHHLPDWIHAASVGATFVVELIIPWLYFGPRRARIVASATTIGLMLVMAARGSYGFFHLLTIALAILVLDDDVMPRVLGGSMARPGTSYRRRWTRAVRLLPATIALAFGVLGASQLHDQLRPRAGALETPLGTLGEWMTDARSDLRRARVLNTYGLFARMTTSRPEIIIEASADGSTWRTIEFRYKPTFMDTQPRMAGLHMPRLDWQLWFAALAGRCDRTRGDWYPRFVLRLLEGNEDVWALTGTNFESTPRQIRARLYDYRFSPRGADVVWVRENERGYCPPVMNLGGELRNVP